MAGQLALGSPLSLALSSTPAAFVPQLHSRHRASPRGPSGALLDIADRRRQVFAEEWEPGWVYRHLLSQSSVFSSASKSDLDLSSAWLLLVATFNTTNAWLSFKVTRPLRWDRHLVLYVDGRQSGNALGRELQTAE